MDLTHLQNLYLASINKISQTRRLLKGHREYIQYFPVNENFLLHSIASLKDAYPGNHYKMKRCTYRFRETIS